MAATAYPPSTKEQVDTALQQAGQYAGSPTPWTPENAPDVGLDPERGFVAKGTPTAPVGPEPPPAVPSPLPEPTPAKPAETPKGDSVYPGAVLVEEPKPEAKKDSQYPGAIPVEEPKPDTKNAPAYPGAIPADEEPKQPPTPAQPAPQPAPQLTTQPQPSAQLPPVTAPTIAEDQPPDPHDQINALIAQGKTPGEAQAIVAGQQPKTLAGKTPEPKPSPAPKIEQPAQPEQPAAAPGYYEKYAIPVAQGGFLKPDGTIDSALADAAQPGGAQTTETQDMGVKPSTPTTVDEKPEVVGGNRLYGTSTIFGLNYDQSIDKSDNGRGIFGANTRNPKLRGVAVPVDVLEKTFGHAFERNAEGGYDMVNTPEAKKVIQAIQSAHIELPDANGKMHSFPIVDIQGSLKGHPGKVLDLTYGAAKDLGFADNHAVSYQIIGGDGKPYPIPETELTGGGGKGGPPAAPGGPGWSPLAGQPLFSIPTGGGGGGQQAQPQKAGPFESGGGGGGQEGGGGGQSGAGTINLGGIATGALLATMLRRGGKQAQPKQPPAEEEAGTELAPTGMKLAKVLSVKTAPPPAAPGPAALGAPKLALPPPPAPDSSVIKGLIKKGFTRQQAEDFATKATVSKAGAETASFRKQPLQPVPLPTQTRLAAEQPPPPPARQAPPLAPPPPPSDLPLPPSEQPARPPEEEVAYEGRPAGSTHGVSHLPGIEALATLRLPEAVKQHAALLSDDDPRVKKQADGMVKGEHFVSGDSVHEQLLDGLPGGQSGRQRQILNEAEGAIADKRPMHISYLSAPKEAEKFPTRDSRKVQYDAHSPEARLLGTTEGQLVGHSFIPTSVGVKLPSKADEPHQSYVQGISTNVLANNVQHLNEKLAAMGRESPYPQLNNKFSADLEGYLANLNAGHTGTGRGHAVGTADHPVTPDEEHVPYRLTRKEADFINTAINNTAAFAKHGDAEKLRELARAHGTLITPEGETNRLRHDIEQHESGWRHRVLEPSIRTFKTGLIMDHHVDEGSMPATIRPGPEFQNLTKAIQRTSERGRPDVPLAISAHHTFAHHGNINKIERDFSEHRINEAEARLRLTALGEDPEEYRFIGGSGGLITPYEEDPEVITPEEHSQMKDGLRKQWVSGKMNVEDYRKRAAEIPLPQKPSQKPQAPPAAAEPDETETPDETPTPAPKAPQEPVAEPEEPAKPKGPPAPDEPLPAKAKPAPTHQFKEVKPEEFIEHRNKSSKPEFLSDLKPEHITKHKLFTNQDNTVGAAVSPEGDIQNVFNNGGEKGAGAHAVAHAIQQHGGKTLDAYDPFLPRYYRQFGFKETGRMKFNPAFAPKWDTAKHGTPDVVFMGHSGEPKGGYAAAIARAKNKDDPNWIPNEQSTRYDDDWDAQKARSQTHAGRTEDYPHAGEGYGAETLPTGDKPSLGSGAAPGRTVAPAPGDVLPPAKKAAPAPAKLEKLIKPKDETGQWKNVPEEDKQTYLEEKVKRTLANQIKDKATHELKVQRNEDGSVKYDPNGSPVYEQHDYDIANSPMLKKKALDQIKGADKHEDTIDPDQHTHLNQVDRKRLSAMREKSAVHTMGDKIVDSYTEAIKNPDIAAGEGWYSRMRKRLGDALGDHHELFAQLLGATSAKTPVRTNFINALDAYEQWKEGMKDPTNMKLGFNKHIAKYLEAHSKLQEGEGALTQHMRDTGILKKKDPDHESDADAMAHWIKHHDILPLAKTGSKYSANSNAVLKVLGGTWLKEVGAPKTPNFAGNLTGRTLEATIDVWAARHLQRLGYEGHGKGPWRAQSAAEPGVSNIDFAFSQDAMRHAADRISKETGKKVNPDDLQAILWFAEKHHYEDRGWTRGQGAEKSSFDDVADKVFGKDGQPMEKPMDSQALRAHYQAEAKAKSQRKGKIETAQSYLGTPHEQAKLPEYMQKHGLTHEEVHGAGDEEEEAA